jgi:DNA end-binding protein Ku
MLETTCVPCPGSRVYWKGFLCLSLVSIAVHARRGRSEAAISFGQIHKQSGQPRENRKVVPSVGVVENADIAKGYEVSDD